MARPETAQQIKAFKAWCLHDRKLIETAKDPGIPKRTLVNWMNAYDWHGRADELSEMVIAGSNAQIVEQKIEEANYRLEAAQELVKWGLEYIREHAPDNTAVALNAIKIGILLDRTWIASSALCQVPSRRHRTKRS